MSAVILAVLDRPDAAKRVLIAAERLAELTAALRINVLALRMPPIATIMVTEEILTRKQEANIRAKERQRVDALKKTFHAFQWTVQPSPPATELVDLEAVPDIAVTGYT